MSPEQALQILMSAAEQAPLPKAAHVQCEQAFVVLRGLVELVAKPEAKPEAKSE